MSLNIEQQTNLTIALHNFLTAKAIFQEAAANIRRVAEWSALEAQQDIARKAMLVVAANHNLTYADVIARKF